MNNEESTFESIISKAEDYGKTSIELIKLKSIDKTADFISSLLSRITIIAILTIFAVFINIGIALWIGELLGKGYYGFLAVASFYALIALVLQVGRHKFIKNPIRNYIIDQLLKF